VSTLGDVVRRIENDLFVGRDREMSMLMAWLDASAAGSPAIFNITGRGGVGKSTVIRRLESYASDRGMGVVHLDGADFAPTPDALALVLGAGSMNEAVARIAAQPTLVTIDTFELLQPLVAPLRDELLAALPAETKVVICGRVGLDDRQWRQWAPLIDHLELGPLGRAASRTYLLRRGITDSGQIEATVLATKGMPLALALAADMVRRNPARGIESTDDLAGLLRGLVYDVAGEVSDPELRTVVDGACVVRRFDQDLLEFILERPSPDAIGRLSQLSFVGIGSHGFVIHDEIRTILESDLRHRDPIRYGRYRERARERYQERMKEEMTPAGRAALMFDALGLDKTVEPHLPKTSAEPSSRAVPYKAADRDAVLRVMKECLEHHPVARTVALDERSEELLGRILDWPHSVVDVARTAGGAIHGFAFLIPLSNETIELLGDDSQIVEALRRWSEMQCRAIPERTADSRVAFISSVQYGVEEPELANAVLMEHGYSLLMRGGVFLALTCHEFYEKAIVSVGGRRLALITNSSEDGEHLGLFELDIDAFGLEEWTTALLAGEQPRRRLTNAELMQAIQSALLKWSDDEALSTSVLTQLMGQRPAGAEGVRQLLESTVERAASAEWELPMRAVRLAYIERSGSIEGVAERLHVSRATLFRILKRAVRELASRLENPVAR
jgi:hypothetical protein